MNPAAAAGMRGAASRRALRMPVGAQSRLLHRVRLLLLLGALLPAPAAAADPPRRSGYRDMGAATQAMQRDDAANPAMLSVLAGEALWREPAPGGRPACVDCHGEPGRLRGVATRYPGFDARTGTALNLDGRINACRQVHQQAPAWSWESAPLLALSALIGLQSRGLPIAPPADERLAAARERGRMRFETRIGQLDLACADCHDRLAGRSLGGTPIPQGHPTGYPLYRLQWQALGSLQRRLRNCMTGVRAQPYPAGSAELIELELHLFQRAEGMPQETPAVRP